MICTTIESLKKYLPTIINQEYEKYEGEVKDANRWFRREIVGDALYAIISEEPQDAEESWHKLLDLSEAIVARKAYLEGIPSYDLTETSGGFVITRNDNQAPASPERVKALMESISRRLTDSIEDLLEFLESETDYHDAWKGSPTYSLLTDTYIHSLRDFRKYAAFPGSRLDFMAARPAMLSVIKLRIEPVISADLSDEIIEQLRDGDLSENNLLIIENLKFAFANFVAGEVDNAQSYILKVRKYLYNHAADFPAFENSELYTELQALTINKYDTERRIFRAGF